MIMQRSPISSSRLGADEPLPPLSSLNALQSKKDPEPQNRQAGPQPALAPLLFIFNAADMDSITHDIKMIASYEDESENGIVARIGEKSHPAHWCARVFERFEVLEDKLAF